MRGGGVERRAHALPDLAVPAPPPGAGSTPAASHRRSSAAWVPERSPRRHEGRARWRRCGAAPRRRRAARATPRRVGGAGPAMTKSLYITCRRGPPMPSRDEALLRRAVMHEHHVGVAAPADVERLAGAERHHAHRDAGVPREDRQDMAEQARLLGGGGGGDRDGPPAPAAPAVARPPPRPAARSRGQQGQEGSAEHAQCHQLSCSSSPDQLAAQEGSRFRSVAGRRRRPRRARAPAARPRCRNRISPASRRAWPRSCVVITTLVPRGGDAGDDALPPRGSRRGRGWRRARRGTAPPAPGRRRGPGRGAAARRPKGAAPAGPRASSRPTRSSAARARAARSARGRPASFSG